MLRYLYLMVFVTLSLMATQWQSEDVDAPYGFGSEPWHVNRGNVVDSQNHIHVVYGGDGVFHKWFDGSQWHREMIDTTHDAGEGVTVAIDANNKLHVAYYDDTNRKIMYATNRSGVWEKKKILDASSYSNLSIAVDKSAKAYVVYTYGGLKYATNNSGNWVSEAVENFDVNDFRILVNSVDQPYILYQDDSGDLKLSSHAISTWNGETVMVDAHVKDLDAVFDSSDKLHLVYSRSSDNNLSYMTNVLGAGSWSTVLLAGDGGTKRYVSIDIDNESHVYISSSEAYSKIAYFTNKSGTFAYKQIDSEFDHSVFPDTVSVDNNKNAHITASGVKDRNFELKYYTNTLGGWSSSLLDQSPRSRVSPSFAISNSGHIFVSDSKYTSGLNMIQFASNQHTTYSVEAIEEERSTRNYSAIGVDSNEKAHISYYDANKQLRYATNALGAWNYNTLDSDINSGEYNALAVDKNDKVHICYYDKNTSEFKYTTNADGGWTTQVLKTSLYVSYRPAITVDESGKVHIVFSDGDLHYASKEVSGNFNIELLPKPEQPDYRDYDAHSDIAVDADGFVHITSGIGLSDYRNDVYITNKLGAWTAIAFDEKAGWYYGQKEYAGRSIAVTKSGCVYLTADDHFYSNCSGEWLGEIAGGDDTIVRLDKQGKVHIVYEKNGNIFHAIKKENSAALVPIINFLLN